MKQSVAILLLLTIPLGVLAEKDSISVSPQKEITEYKGYKLIWNDEFDKDGKPADHWSYEKGFVRNNEAQWYQSDNASVKNGTLIIEGRKETVVNPNYKAGSSDWRTNRRTASYTSSSLTTKESFHFKYGRVEVRAKIPTASGSWPAIWLLGNQGEWPQNGEIDMLEYYISGGKPSILANACWGGTQRWQPIWDTTITPFTHFTSRDADWAEKFHIWRMDWDEKYIRLYLDDELLNEVTLSGTVNQGYGGNTINPFSNYIKDFGDYILLNLALGANGGTPNDSKFPLRYYIDFVRVYQSDIKAPQGYCPISISETNKEVALAQRWLKSVETTGCETNLSYTSSTPSTTGWVVAPTMIVVKKGSTFRLTAKANQGNDDIQYCRAALYADWDRDTSFYSSPTERLLTVGTANASNVTLLNHTFTITVPETAVEGESRLRLCYADAWRGLPEACGELYKGFAFDIPMKIVSASTDIQPIVQGVKYKWENDVLQLEKPARLSVYGVNGVLVDQTTNVKSYNTNHLEKGVYTVVLSVDGANNCVLKFQKK